MPEYVPDGAALEAFLNSNAFVRGIRGPVRGGKSAACCCDLLDRSIEQAPGPDGVRRTRWVAVRSTYPELRTTTLETIKQWVPPELGKVVMGSPIEIRVRARLEDSTRVESDWWLMSLDRDEDVRKLLSLEITGAWLHEARELPKQVLMRMTERVDQYPPQRDGGATWAGIVMDTNPPDTEHWWYQFAEVDTPAGWEFFAQPSARSPEAENIKNLPPGYYEKALAGKTPDEIKVYFDGEYGFVQEGRAVYTEYQDHLHCGDGEFEGDPALPLLVGLDFGWSAAAVIAQRDGHDRWSVLDELVSEDLNTQAFAEAAVRKLARDWPGYKIGNVWGDPAGRASRAEVSEDQPNTHMAICRAAGLPVQPAPTNDQRLRHAAVGGLLSRLVGGRPCLRLHRRCVQLRKGFNGRYRWPKRIVGGGDEAYGTTPVKNLQSHPHDALQYAVLGGGEGQKLVSIQGIKLPRIPPKKRYGAWARG